MKIAAELVARCFAARTAMHFAHLSTSSYSQHMALGEFYDAVAEHADAFAEVYMGVEGKVKVWPVVAAPTDASPVEYLTQLYAWVTDNRAKACEGNRELENIVDELLQTIARTSYKIQFLK